MPPLAVRGQLLLEGGFVAGAVVIDGPRIVDVIRGASVSVPVDCREARFIAPGFIDLQVNGGFGVSVEQGGGAIRELAARLPSTGVVAFLPTLVSLTAAEYPSLLAGWDAVAQAAGAVPLGLHLEGPLLSLGRCGAHEGAAIAAATPELVGRLATSAAVKMVTLAPERPGALALTKTLAERGTLVALGHSEAPYELAVEAARAGARMITHLYNAMPPFHHRAPGLVGAAWLDERFSAGIICDGVHAHAASIRLAHRIMGHGRLALVTDAIAAAGAGPGSYRLGAQTLEVDEVAARLPDGTLAGSVLTLDRAIRNAVDFGIPPADALRMAAETPARLLGLTNKGRIAKGADADLVLLDDELRVEATLVAGACVYDAKLVG